MNMTRSNADSVIAAAQRLIRDEGRAIDAVAGQVDDSFVVVVEKVLGCQGMVFVTGGGTSGAVARRMAHLLSVCGTPAMFLPPMDALHGTMGAVRSGDLMIAISKGGESSEINELALRVSAVGAEVIALTADTASTLARHADTVVRIESPGDIDPGGLIAMGSTLTVAAWGDALSLVLMRVRGHGWQDVMHIHPAGAVGQRDQLPAPLEPLSAADGGDNGAP